MIAVLTALVALMNVPEVFAGDSFDCSELVQWSAAQASSTDAVNISHVKHHTCLYSKESGWHRSGRSPKLAVCQPTEEQRHWLRQREKVSRTISPGRVRK
jgi:hypothetical protein